MLLLLFAGEEPTKALLRHVQQMLCDSLRGLFHKGLLKWNRDRGVAVCFSADSAQEGAKLRFLTPRPRCTWVSEVAQVKVAECEQFEPAVLLNDPRHCILFLHALIIPEMA